ncbi:helix-turn-helix transcriptional regulator [Pseudonocardia tropica]|uniref:Helix-turn-helix transcriptional regulator n=1 Tax=Pseudonocardia tropica TaxID=681289 RepID=A0ABV1K241_9PSEU
MGRLLALRADDDPELAPVMPALRAWWARYDESGEVAPPAPPGDSGTVGLLATVPWELLPPTVLLWTWGAEGPLRDMLSVRIPELRRRQELPALAMLLSQTAVLDLFGGRWRSCEDAATEAVRLAEEVGAEHLITQGRLCLANLAAARGDTSVVEDHAVSTLRVSAAHGVRALAASAFWVRGRAALLGGRPQEALRHLLPLTEPGHEAAHRTTALLAALDTAEAAAQTVRADVVRSRVAMMEAWVDRTGAVWARAALHRLRALGDGEPTGTETSYRAALETGAGGDPFEHARTLLLYGEWLRRTRRRAAAREQLTGAAEVFQRLGAAPLWTRALRELDLAEGAGTGLQPAGLTAQELRVARLAAAGLTNRQIAAQLLISHRTVGHHLASVYPKLGVTSRTELAQIDMSGDLRLRG